MINTKDLELVRCVAESGSLTHAAKRMHVSQSAVSQRLTNLQDRLDLKLFERSAGSLRLTAPGERVFAASKIVGDEIRSTLIDIRQLARKRDEQLRITTQCYTCYRWLPFVIAGLRKDHPLLNVDVVPDATDSPYEALREDRIDVAIVSQPVASTDFDEQDLFSDEFFAVMSSSHPLASEKYLRPAQFADQTLLLYTGNSHAIVQEVLAPANVEPANIIQVRITEAIIELARSGHGIAVIAGWALDDIGDTAGLNAVRITRHGFKRNWRAVFAAHCNGNHVESFLRRMRETGAVIQDREWRKQLQRRSRDENRPR